jgi:hypothetical protein
VKDLTFCSSSVCEELQLRSHEQPVREQRCMQLVPGRCEVVDEGQKFQVIVDSANTPERLEALLMTVRECSDCKRIILVFGCGADDPQEMRPRMGNAADRLADIVIVTNDNPGNELPHNIVEHITGGFPQEVRHAFPGCNWNYLVDVGHVEQVRSLRLCARSLLWNDASLISADQVAAVRNAAISCMHWLIQATRTPDHMASFAAAAFSSSSSSSKCASGLDQSGGMEQDLHSYPNKACMLRHLVNFTVLLQPTSNRWQGPVLG